ncbi:MAG TPA: NADH-quinone oxidoreductase subunit NuoE [Tepidisphaeraceae bacterium]|jgi:NADH-quinone oxidoreductase subunit E
MAWLVENRRTATVERRDEAYLTDDMKIDIANTYFPRYPTKRAVTLPALHRVQHTYGWIPLQAVEEIAAFLELAPAEVLDTATFYEEFWLKPKGKYLIAICRSLACELCGSTQLTKRIGRKLGIEVGETTPDGKFTLMEYECLGACGTAPVALVNEVLHENLTAENFERVLDGLPEDAEEYRDPSVTWERGHK